jgi:fluoride exporter
VSEPKRLALVAIGGTVGALLRYAISLFVESGLLESGLVESGLVESGLYWATLLVNILGAIAIGVIAGLLARGGPQALWPFLVTGLLGGFTTVSAMALETFELIETGSLLLAAGYFTLTVAGGLLAVYLGHRVAGDRS